MRHSRRHGAGLALAPCNPKSRLQVEIPVAGWHRCFKARLRCPPTLYQKSSNARGGDREATSPGPAHTPAGGSTKMSCPCHCGNLQSTPAPAHMPHPNWTAGPTGSMPSGRHKAERLICHCGYSSKQSILAVLACREEVNAWMVQCNQDIHNPCYCNRQPMPYLVRIFLASMTVTASKAFGCPCFRSGCLSCTYFSRLALSWQRSSLILAAPHVLMHVR